MSPAPRRSWPMTTGSSSSSSASKSSPRRRPGTPDPVTTIPRAILAVDAGAATTAVTLLGRPADRWRLLGSLAGPATADPDSMAGVLIDRLRALDRELAERIGVQRESIGEIAHLACGTEPPRTLAVLAASRRAVGLLESVAARTPWRVVSASPERYDPREMTE